MNRKIKHSTLIRAVFLNTCAYKQVSLSYYMRPTTQPRRSFEDIHTGPRIVACQWKVSSSTGPAEHEEGGSRVMSLNSYKLVHNVSPHLAIPIGQPCCEHHCPVEITFWIRLRAIVVVGGATRVRDGTAHDADFVWCMIHHAHDESQSCWLFNTTPLNTNKCYFFQLIECSCYWLSMYSNRHRRMYTCSIFWLRGLSGGPAHQRWPCIKAIIMYQYPGTWKSASCSPCSMLLVMIWW